MKRLFLILILSFFINQKSTSQNMTNDRLGELIEAASDSVVGQSGRWQFYVEDVVLLCLTDSENNRMRIISPIAEVNQLTEDLAKAALIANFHTALDVKYAISEELVWSTFIHRLSELTEDQVNDAIAQVYAANITFGTTFSSTDLVFPGNASSNKPEKKAVKKERF